ARAVFVAEMAEVMMDRRNQATGKITWRADNSMGEALSTVCEALLHPEGYYGANLGPRIATWLNPQVRTHPPAVHYRHNSVEQREPTDGNYASFGCGILFLYYLVSQLGLPLPEVIAKGGATFEEAYRNLTGRSGAWKEFRSLLDLYFPEGLNNFFFPARDNLFPLP